MSQLDWGAMRQRINSLDGQILELLNQRAQAAVEIGRAKLESARPIYDPAREREVISDLQKMNQGPLAAGAVNRIYAEIISACRSLQGPTQVAFPGSEASLPHLAALNHFGKGTGFMPRRSIGAVFAEVERGRADYGVAPVENSTGNDEGQTLDLLADSSLTIVGEIFQPVSLALMSQAGELENIEKIYVQPRILSRCQNWLAKNMNWVSVTETDSTAEAARRAQDEPNSAAIGNPLLAQLQGLDLLAEGIQDRNRDTARFVVLGKQGCSATGRDKTSLVFSTPHAPGSLSACLEPLTRAGLNMSRIESRPSPKDDWSYVFFVDLGGYVTDETVDQAVKQMADRVEWLKVLGSYPKGHPGD